MNIFGLGQNTQGLYIEPAARENSHREVLPGFHALTLKEKCLYLVKISKRNTSHQMLVVAGLTVLALAADYLMQ
ncbi:hypothetical protein [Sinanaerobacter chloroacetimidivorans]|jgi:hypothetical protein|uniref:Uncharacterized protein n=1 Tax=Sinanaerobacter chloroacetimidivorans TaxID=2818044 RepID=A0A8J7W5D1_9FIRM|nr:hypothetical protein [Sinanaerobacter chloroacetimidivorans]MBR0600576.1 hypothetical protein [Sinanaerobacter chloroacetimidivorans]